MPSVVLCPRCQTRFDAPPASGVCPQCGSRLAPETAPPGSTPAGTRPPGPDSPTVTAPGTAELPTWSAGTARPLPPTPPPPDLPGYTDLTPVGIGGMGAVYRAVQRGTDRVVAVKFVHPVWAADRGLLKRFENEAKALARVKHTGVVQVFEVGSDGGPPYFSMEYVPGGTLTKLIRAGPVAPRDAATIMAAVAGAVASAHAEGLLHRDIKPGNVLLAADGTPKVTDFGLAKFTAEADGQTVTGAVLGTPSYMAPEQAAGRTADVRERTDVYGIGATLYELLTGRPPFKGPDHAATIVMVLTDEVTAPRAVRPDVPAELEAVCLKCLEKAPAKRYPSAQAVADELGRWLVGKPTEVRPLTRWGKVRRWAGRNRVLLAVAALAALAGAAAFVLDPKRQIGWTLALGRPATLVGEKGLPRYHRWELDEVALIQPPDAEGAPGFQTQTLSLLELAPDTGSTRYRVSAEIRHLGGREGDSAVGVYLGPSSAVAPDGTRVARWYGFQFTEYPRPEVSRPGLVGYDWVTLRLPHAAEPWPTNLGPVYLFPPAKFDPTPWRRIVLDVSPDRIDVYWRQPDGTLAEAVPRPADRVEKADGITRAQFAPPRDTRGLPVPAWSPRGPVGVYARNAYVAFRNVTIDPSPSAPPH